MMIFHSYVNVYQRVDRTHPHDQKIHGIPWHSHGIQCTLRARTWGGARSCPSCPSRVCFLNEPKIWHPRPPKSSTMDQDSLHQGKPWIIMDYPRVFFSDTFSMFKIWTGMALPPTLFRLLHGVSQPHPTKHKIGWGICPRKGVEKP